MIGIKNLPISFRKEDNFYIVAGWPGSVHDSRALRNSGLYQTAAIKFPGDTHLLGDGGYPLLRSVDFPIV